MQQPETIGPNEFSDLVDVLVDHYPMQQALSQGQKKAYYSACDRYDAATVRKVMAKIPFDHPRRFPNAGELRDAFREEQAHINARRSAERAIAANEVHAGEPAIFFPTREMAEKCDNPEVAAVMMHIAREVEKTPDDKEGAMYRYLFPDDLQDDKTQA